MKKLTDDFVIFILSNGRPDKVLTVKLLEKYQYKGPWYIIVDNLDKTANRYFEKYGEHVIQFDKRKVAELTDPCDNTGRLDTILQARNACFRIAQYLGFKYYLMLEDDYTAFCYRFIKGNSLKAVQIKDLNKICEIMLEFLVNTPTKSIAMAQAGDFIGGVGNDRLKKGLMRKCMNTFFCSTDRPVWFFGRINDDVNFVCFKRFARRVIFQYN